MKYIIILLTSLFLVSNAMAEDVSERCLAFKDFEKTINADLPKKIDNATELTSVFVNCTTKIIKYTKRVLAYDSDMAEGWRERKQRQHILLHCNKDGLSSTVGWNAQDDMYDIDYNFLVTLFSSPDDCVKIYEEE
jgi:hypothetical protein